MSGLIESARVAVTPRPISTPSRSERVMLFTHGLSRRETQSADVDLRAISLCQRRALGTVDHNIAEHNLLGMGAGEPALRLKVHVVEGHILDRHLAQPGDASGIPRTAGGDIAEQ